MMSYVFIVESIKIVSPSTVSTLRTTQIIVSFVVQTVVRGAFPPLLDFTGAVLVFMFAVVITMEKEVHGTVARLKNVAVGARVRNGVKKSAYERIE